MDKVFKKKNELPPPPELPSSEQISQDLKSAPPDDPVFYENSHLLLQDENDDFHLAQDFMATTLKLQETHKLLTSKKSQLEECLSELKTMSDNIRQQATQALSSIY